MKTEAEDWIKWDTSNYDCPVSTETQVEVIDITGVRHRGHAGRFYWFYQGWVTDISRYRVIA